MSFAGKLICHDYNTFGHDSASKKGDSTVERTKKK